jgi:hypothetical protein
VIIEFLVKLVRQLSLSLNSLWCVMDDLPEGGALSIFVCGFESHNDLRTLRNEEDGVKGTWHVGGECLV